MNTQLNQHLIQEVNEKIIPLIPHNTTCVSAHVVFKRNEGTIVRRVDTPLLNIIYIDNGEIAKIPTHLIQVWNTYDTFDVIAIDPFTKVKRCGRCRNPGHVRNMCPMTSSQRPNTRERVRMTEANSTEDIRIHPSPPGGRSISRTVSEIMDDIVESANQHRRRRVRRQQHVEYQMSEPITTPPVKDSNCQICLSKIEDNYIYLECFHMYHTDCIKEWLPRSASCPICKARVKTTKQSNSEPIIID